MDCKSCDTGMTKLSPGVYYCPECKEVYEVTDDKQTTVKNKKKFFQELQETVTAFTDSIKIILDELGIKLEKGKKADNEDKDGFPWG